MKKMIFTMSIICLIVFVYACGRGNIKQINFIKNNEKTLEQMLTQAKVHKKILFVDVYTTWCGPCKWMDENTFKDSRVSEKFNKTFLNFKVDGDSFEGVNVGIIHRVESYPTYLFVAPNGKVIHRIEGTISPEGLVREADFVVNRASK
jgi:hypothetical protein